MPAKVVPINLNEVGSVTSTFGSFLSASSVDTALDIDWDCMKCCCGGGGFFMEHITGPGWAFLEGGGTVLERPLKEGEKILIDNNTLLAMSGGCKIGLKRTGNCLNCCCSGEGMFFTTVEGPGVVWLQGTSRAKMMMAMTRAA